MKTDWSVSGSPHNSSSLKLSSCLWLLGTNRVLSLQSSVQITFEEGPQLPQAANISCVTCKGQSDHSMVRLCCSELYTVVLLHWWCVLQGLLRPLWWRWWNQGGFGWGLFGVLSPVWRLWSCASVSSVREHVLVEPGCMNTEPKHQGPTVESRREFSFTAQGLKWWVCSELGTWWE